MQFRHAGDSRRQRARPPNRSGRPAIHMAATYVQPGRASGASSIIRAAATPRARPWKRPWLRSSRAARPWPFLRMAAIHCVTMLLESGDHVVSGADIYGGTFRLLHKIVNRSGIAVTLVDTSNLAAVEAAMTPRTKLLWIESPAIRCCPSRISRLARIWRGGAACSWASTTRSPPRAHATLGTRRRRGHALGHQVSGRP